MSNITISPNLSVIEQARHYFSPEYLTQYCLSYYYTVCAYNSHWVEVHYGRINELGIEANSHSKEHALNFIKSDIKLKKIIELLGLGQINLNFRNLGTEKKSKILRKSDDVIALTIESRNSKLWDANKAYEVIAVLPTEQRLISVAASSIKGITVQQDDEDIPSFVGTNDISTTGLALQINRVKLPLYISKGRILTEGNVILERREDNKQIWKQGFLLRTVAHADVISNSLRVKDNELNFDHLLLLSHPSEHGKTILGQYFLTPIRVDDYDYELGKEISQRVIRQEKASSQDNFYITSKLGRRIERAFERNGEVYIIALVKQYFGQNTKRIVDYIVVGKNDYQNALEIAINNEMERGVNYLSLKDILQSDNSSLENKYGQLEKGHRVQHFKEKKWGIGTVLGFRHLDEKRVVARIEFQYGGVREILCGEYIELIEAGSRNTAV